MNAYVDAVPFSLFVAKTKKCFWAPKSTDNAKILPATRNKESPKKSWPIYSATRVGIYKEESEIL
jgi:hypothetical protein